MSKYKNTKIQLLGSGAILREMIAAAEILQNEYQIDSEIWSVTSFSELRRDGLEVERYNLLNPAGEKKVTYIDFIAEKTIDEKIIKSLRNKINIATKVLGEDFKEWLI